MYEVNCLDLDGNTINNFFQWDVDQKIMIKVKGCEEDYLGIAPEVHFANTKSKEALVVRSWLSGRITSETNVRSKPDDSSDDNINGALNEGDEIVYTEYAEYSANNADNDNLIVNTTYAGGDKEWCVIEYNNSKCYVESSCIERNVDTIVADVPNSLLEEPYPLLVYVYLTDSDDVSSQMTILYGELPVRKRAKPSDYKYVENITPVTYKMIKDELEEAIKNTSKTAEEDIVNTKDAAISVIDEKEQGYIYAGEMLVGYGIGYEDVANRTEGSAEYLNGVLIGYGEEPQENSARWLLYHVKGAASSAITDIEDTASTATALIESTASDAKTKIETVASETKTYIENDIGTKIVDNGVEMKTTDDGNGNITMSIAILQS